MHSPRPHTKHKCIKEMLNEQGYSASSSRGDVHDICKCYKCQATHYAKKCKELKKAREAKKEKKQEEQKANKFGINIEEEVKSFPKKILDNVITTILYIESMNMWKKFGKSFLGRG
ncbi:hypothetical protein EV182_003744 [Spiromyces aspiralis]|uniref:Uncharacterized protein n=1 Tax=Spiromyces aspiralis TaxID=68401 RepID=A0ACC1HS45_9FUNG|nr:hypothetical protein EV182_003744 [Spiromyces aspiralis]